MTNLLKESTQVTDHDTALSEACCHIGSMVVYSKPEYQESLVRSCEEIPHCTTYTGDRKTAFVLVIESDDEASLREIIAQIHALRHVINASLVYHHCDSQESLSEEIAT